MGFPGVARFKRWYSSLRFSNKTDLSPPRMTLLLSLPSSAPIYRSSFGVVPWQQFEQLLSKLRLLLLKGSVLRIKDGEEQALYWPEISRALRQSLNARNADQFALSFRRLIVCNSSNIKEKLLKIGVCGIEAVAAPVFSKNWFLFPVFWIIGSTEIHSTKTRTLLLKI